MELILSYRDKKKAKSEMSLKFQVGSTIGIFSGLFIRLYVYSRKPNYMNHWYNSQYILNYRVAQKKVYTCMLQTLISHKSHFLLIFEGKTYVNEKVIHERVYFSVCPP